MAHFMFHPKDTLVSIAALILLALPPDATAQSSTSTGIFPTWNHSGKISDRMSYGAYYFTAEHFGGTGSAYIKSSFLRYGEQSLTWALLPNLKLTGSYVWERLKMTDGWWRRENRFYAQLSYHSTQGDTRFTHRVRFDGRYIEQRKDGPFVYGHRIRYLTGFQKSLKKTKALKYVGAYNEFFFNTSDEGPVIYAENWASAYVGFPITKGFTIEAGPLYIFWVTGEGRSLNNLLYGQITLSTELDLKRSAASSTIAPAN